MTGESDGRPGQVILVRTFRNRAANCNPHLHCLVSDGVFLSDGTGYILYPASFWPADTFEVLSVSPPDPVLIESYYRHWPDTTTFRTKADEVWESLRIPDLAGTFAQRPYTAGMLLYTPATGLLDPKKAKRIVFLFQKQRE
jgi:hypothetical protein